VQLPAAGHTTANSRLDGDPAGLGVAWMRQLRPFHRSARVRCAPDLVTNCPTPVHAEAEEHDTPFRALAAAPGGFGVDWTVQVPPPRRSASVTPSPDPLTCKPTAVQTEVVGQETAGPNAAPNKPFTARGFGVGVIDHPDPAGSGDSARTPAVTGPPAASKITAAPVTAATRLIRPRIATPHLPQEPLAARVTADKPGSSAQPRGEAWRRNRELPAPVGANFCTDLTLASRTGRKVRPRQAAVSATMPRPPHLAGATRVCACPQSRPDARTRPFPKAEESPTAKPLSIQNGLYALMSRLMFEPATTRVFGVMR
jgi:hypothetical protein